MARDDLIRLDVFGAEKALAEFKDALDQVKNGAKKAVVRALRKTAQGMRTDVVRVIREEYNVPAGEIRRAMYLVLPSMSDKTPRAMLKAKGRMSVHLIQYGARPSKPVDEGARRPKAGVSVAVKKASGRKAIAKSFIQRSPQGTPQMYKRVGDDRYPLRKLYGPSHLQMLRDDDTIRQLQDLADERLATNIEHEAEHVLRQAGLR